MTESKESIQSRLQVLHIIHEKQSFKGMSRPCRGNIAHSLAFRQDSLDTLRAPEEEGQLIESHRLLAVLANSLSQFYHLEEADFLVLKHFRMRQTDHIGVITAGRNLQRRLRLLAEQGRVLAAVKICFLEKLLHKVECLIHDSLFL